MEITSENKESINNFTKESKATTVFSLRYDGNKNDYFDVELSFDGTNSKSFFEKELTKVETEDVEILHYKIDDEELQCIPVSENNLEKCDEVEDLTKTCYSRAGCHFEINNLTGNNNVSNCHDKGDGLSKNKSARKIDLKRNGNDKLKNVDSNCSDDKSRLKNVINGIDTGPYIKDTFSILQKKQKKRGYRCTIGDCKRTFFHIGSFKLHQLLHNESKFKCKYCGKVLCDSSKLKNHESAHFNEKGYMIFYPCLVPDCDEVFCSYELLRNHEVCHDLESKPFVCEICDKHFCSKTRYATHLLIHDTDSSHKCLECGKCFVYEAALRHHRRAHLLPKKFICNQCGADFIKYSNFIRHTEIHNGKKHICKICRSSYSYSRTLTRHMIKEHPIARNKELESLQDNGKKRKKKVINCVRMFYSHFQGKRE